MQTLNAKDAKNGCGRLIDLARAKPIVVAKYGRPVVVMLALEEYERLKALDVSADRNARREAKNGECARCWWTRPA
ncbi:MAG: type II toxin-antitoxin system Phd/YefM family antitoxin [Albidovulum sp.]|nr:type II toxin-antitoxin system Phd/YefM family antitoxin [Albidovulum sp.]